MNELVKQLRRIDKKKKQLLKDPRQLEESLRTSSQNFTCPSSSPGKQNIISPESVNFIVELASIKKREELTQDDICEIHRITTQGEESAKPGCIRTGFRSGVAIEKGPERPIYTPSAMDLKRYIPIFIKWINSIFFGL